ncbi:MAG: RluA family pseudouridine synthase [Planctomycetaceae bacterium]|nr:RluA family pseudouridine synthase [Planctomycetaceae bacterium]MBQ2820217.1 RluA family pseudouridine synthase [Thermoguttaceae bacterium]MDO4425514.1 RluA family pseudouridine synthase [Planctomycetia bacterium]
MVKNLMQILYEDNHLLVVVKPAGLPTMGVSEGEKSLLTLAKNYVAEKYQKPGNVYLGVVSRLDTPTTGLVVIARTSKAASRLCEQFRTHTVRKLYVAVVDGRIPEESGTLRNFMAEEKRHRKMFVTQDPGGIPAVLHYQVVKRFESRTMLQIHLETGRKHQIRVQLSHLGFPITGDFKYRSRSKFPAGIALHAHEITFTHPTLGTELHFTAPFPATWKEFFN